MRAKKVAALVGGMLVAASCGPELTVGDITGATSTASGSGGAASGGGGTSGLGGAASGGGGTSGSGGACVAQPVDQWAHWTLPTGFDKPGAANYDTSVAGVVKDKTTGLRWQADLDPASFTWQDAIDYCKKPHAGFCDWRLPTRMELLTLVHYGHVSPASTFPNMPSDWFWSSSVYASGSSLAWYVYFDSGSSTPTARATPTAFVAFVEDGVWTS